MWQRGPPAPREYTSRKIERDMVADQKLLAKMHEQDRAPASSGSRPRPVLSGAVDLGQWNLVSVNNVTHDLNMA